MSQIDFAKALLDNERPTPGGLIDPKGRPAGKRFDVYRNNVVLSLSDALSDAYPVVQKLVGDKFFQAMAGVFVRQHPPKSPIISQFAPEFPDFLAAFPPVAKLTYLPDVARLEKARTEAYHALDATPIDGAALAALTPEQMSEAKLRLHPSLYIISSPFPVFAIWQQNSDAPETAIPKHGQDVLIARPSDMVEMRTLPPGAADFLRALNAGRTLGETIEFCEKIPLFDLTENIGGLFESNLLIKIES
ncbi:MAG: putative DNA-binding domain-containing protein [Rhodobacteraceae bacterium]|nr:putative DNA-binding domain-containing protein [Paracoccaceae bacterium]